MEGKDNFSGKIGDGDAPTIHTDEQGADTHTFTQFPDSAVDVDEENENTSDTARLVDQNKNPIWSFAYYQTLFDVDTNVVLNRIKGSMIPMPSRSFKSAYIGGKPDLYGPFWICATLVLVVGVCGNLTTLLKNYGDEKYHYTPQFERLSVAGIIVYSYTFLVPLIVKGLMWWRKSSVGFSIPDIMCIYGYSLFIFIPISFLLLIPIAWLDWVVISVAILLSGTVLLLSLWPAFRDDSKKMGIILCIVLFALHTAMAMGLRLYFFSTLSTDAGVNTTTSTPSNSPAQIKFQSLPKTTTLTSSPIVKSFNVPDHS